VVHSNRAIHTIDEMHGLRLHVQTRFAGDAVHALGAAAVPMPSVQLPLAITQHVIDGCIDPWQLVPALKLNDLLKAHTEFADSSLSSTTFVLAMNKASYDRLPRELKAVIDANSGQPAAGMAGAMWDLQAAAVADMVAQRGDPITTLLPEAVAHWRKATEPVIEAWQKSMKEQKTDGGKLLSSAHALMAKYVNEPEPQPAQVPQPEQVSEPVQPSQPQLPAQAKADVNTMPKLDVPSPASAKPAAPTPPAAKPTVTPTASAAAQAPAPMKPLTSPAHTATPVKPPPQPVQAAAPPPPSTSPAPVTASSAAVVNPVPVPAPAVPVAKPPPPKTLDIPL
jgi:hypothetical protein